MPDDFKQAIEQIKLRVPIEELVRERVPGLRKSGRLWTACCPFHDEGTPSFKVDPAKGTWRCYGACGIGGDVISFLEKHDHLDFREALDVLAARSGVEIPSFAKGLQRKPRGADDPLYEVLERASVYYQRLLHRSEGAQALGYLQSRGLSSTTIEAFGLGYSAPGGEVMVGKVLAQGQPIESLLAAGLARRNDQGRPYDFFRGRLMIPIRDERSRTVGFGARRLDDSDKQSPKYVNTSETEVFHKGRLIFALDHAQAEIRRSGHMILVEGYTDVMAAHQAGVRNVVAVLGTALTEEHAALVRRSGAKRVTLCFDGDVAGQQATWRALSGLLGLDIEIDVVRLVFDKPSEADEDAVVIKDPCDLLVQRGASAFLEQIAGAANWFSFLLASIDPLEDQQRWQTIDRVLELLTRLQKPIQRDARLTELAAHLGLSASAVREQFQSLPTRTRERAQERQRAETKAASPAADAASNAGSDASRGPSRPAARTEPVSRADAMLTQAWRQLVGAVLLDGSLAPALGELLELEGSACPNADVASLASELLRVARREGALPDLNGVMAQLCEHPSRDLIVPLIEEAAAAESPSVLFDGAGRHLQRVSSEKRHAKRIAELALLARSSPAEHKERLTELHRDLSREKFAVLHPTSGEPASSPVHR